MDNYKKIEHPYNKDVVLRYVAGHFVTPNSHVNYYMDLSDMKSRQREARATGEEIASLYSYNTQIDTILCLDNMEIVGAYVANSLTKAGHLSQNSHKTLYITTPEYNISGQIMFRENIQHMINGKNVLILAATITTGSTIRSAIRSVQYYGGNVTGVAAIFSSASKIMDIPIQGVYSQKDLPDYNTSTPDNCPLCASKTPISAICNGYGYSTVQ